IESDSVVVENLLEKIINNLSEGVVITDRRGKILFVNAFFESLTGYRYEEVVGQNPKILQSGAHNKDYYKNMWECINTYGLWQGEIWNRQKDGEVYPEWLKILAIKNEQDEITHYVGIFSDLSEKKGVEVELEEKILTDTLTNINNRYSYSVKMNSLLESSSSLLDSKIQHAIFFLDLNRFKQVNDTLGHTTGDLLLVEMAQRLKSLISEKDILARHGGDEFIITLTNIQHPREAAQFAEQVIRAIEKPVVINGHEIYMSTSIGISLYPNDGQTTDELIYCADKAMYYAKQKGMNGFSFYFDELNIDTERVLLLDNELRKAIEKKQFTLHYQPKLCLKTNKIIGLEALVRWNNEKLGIVPPDEFIAYAEESGLIIPLSEIIFELVCKGLQKFHQAGHDNISIAINVSSIHFQQYNFLESILDILHRNNTKAENIEIEVTERTLMTNDSDTIEKLTKLKELGFKLSIDDFGTGYSSLSYLVRFPIDYLKIDRSFIQYLTTFDDRKAVVEAIIQMAHGLKMDVIAEGVETAQQIQFLKKMDCDYIQGYYFCRPQPVDVIIDFLTKWKNEHQGWSKV
ncbi:MAG: EAL domain-containing protein, partial [Lysinibacillus sp.]|nr:EAL domain-containing protein [Lysinibacillus sp.]